MNAADNDRLRRSIPAISPPSLLLMTSGVAALPVIGEKLKTQVYRRAFLSTLPTAVKGMALVNSIVLGRL